MKNILLSAEYLFIGYLLKLLIEWLNIPIFSLTSFAMTIVAFVLFQFIDSIIWKEKN